ncbi:ABC transporter permease [Mesoplasma photuris]|uniref:ABC transporter permease n=1 Tax=Mesoplasma photuris TaxID=217731 RepID=UPI0004E0FE0B|nr:ABC transporter permease [Mesoplasma photuris]
MKTINSFEKKNQIIKTHLKSNWKYILFLTLFWTVMALASTMIINLGNLELYIAPSSHVTMGGGHSGAMALEEVTGMILHSVPAMVFFGGAMISLIIIVISKEVKSGKISFWMTTSLSRTNILIYKALFIWIVISVVYFVSEIPVIGYFSSAGDASQNIGYLFAEMIYFWIFLTVLLSVFILIFLLFINKDLLPILICSGILFYMIVTYALILMSNMLPDIFGWAENLKYVAIQSLFLELLNFTPAPDLVLPPGTPPGTYTSLGEFIKPNIAWAIISPLLNIGIITGCLFTSNWIFKKQDLNI